MNDPRFIRFNGDTRIHIEDHAGASVCGIGSLFAIPCAAVGPKAERFVDGSLVPICPHCAEVRPDFALRTVAARDPLPW